MSDQDRWAFSIEEVRIKLGLGRSSMYEAIRRNEIPHLRIGRRILIPRGALEQLLNKQLNRRDSSS